MNDKTLVERLRNLAEEWFEMCDDIHEPLSEAADTIEALQSRIKALEARLEIEPSHPYDGIDARDATIRLLEQRIEALETEKRKLALDLLAALGQNADALESKP